MFICVPFHPPTFSFPKRPHYFLSRPRLFFTVHSHPEKHTTVWEHCEFFFVACISKRTSPSLPPFLLLPRFLPASLSLPFLPASHFSNLPTYPSLPSCSSHSCYLSLPSHSPLSPCFSANTPSSPPHVNFYGCVDISSSSSGFGDASL